MFDDRYWEIREKLTRIIYRLPAPESWREDLLQDALLRFVELEQKKPLQELAYYIQGCKFHLQKNSPALAQPGGNEIGVTGRDDFGGVRSIRG